MKILAFEGIHGAGKSTIITSLEAELRDKGVRTARLAMNSDPVWREVNNELRRAGQLATTHSYLLSMVTDLQLQLEAISSQRNVDVLLADRYVGSLIARAEARPSPAWLKEWISDVVAEFPRASLTMVLDVPVAVALERSVPKNDTSWRIGFDELYRSDSLSADDYSEYLGRLRACFARLYATDTAAFFLDASGQVDETRRAASVHLQTWLAHTALH